MTTTLDETPVSAPSPAAPRGGALRTTLLLVIAVALVLLGGAGAVALGIGRSASPSADSVDAGFAWDMSRHHLQGVQMANLVAARTNDPLIKSLGFDISSTQTNQTGRMQGWLSLWGLPQNNPNAPMAWMSGSSDGMSGMGDMSMPALPAGALMPGMATDAELAHLQSLSGTAFDVDFLRLMIRHHQGGLKMAEYAEAHAKEPAVRELAKSMAETQTAEVGTMTQLLTAKGGTPLPAP